MDWTMTQHPRIDVHIHLTGTGCCDSGCWIAPKFRHRFTFRAIKLIQGMTEHEMNTDIDVIWPERVAHLLKESAIDWGVVLGFDQVFDHATGAPSPEKSQMYVPPEWVFQVCRENSGLLPGPSVNPFAADALERLEYCIQEGAVLIKWLPATQHIDPASPQLRDFYRLMAKHNLPLLIHIGRERTFEELSPQYGRLHRLELPLSLGVTVICAHSATRVLGTREPDDRPLLLEMLKKYPHMYLDNSGICNPSRFAHLPGLAKDPLIMSRTLYGSDWPVPSNAIYFLGKMPIKKVLELEQLKNPFDRDIEIKRYFGVPDETMTRANHVLAHLDRWIGGQTQSMRAPS
jgi:predicted TIM-barrel fold metal-dependent hydrolase